MPATPMYEDLVGSEDPLELLATTPDRIARLVRPWRPARWKASYAPGKWSGAQIVLHLAQDEIGWSKRIRLALNDPAYVVQPYDAAVWVERETPVDGLAALEAYLALRRLNLGLYRGIGEEERLRAFRHPEFGEMSIDWILRTLAGHDLHHLKQLEAVRP
jgi:DinB superfamily